jgi:hypothetical protein
MTYTAFIEALAAQFRAYGTDPLKSCAVYTRDQEAVSEDVDWVMVGLDPTWEETALWVSQEGFMDDWTFRIRGSIPYADTLANEQKIEVLAKQLHFVLRNNRQLAVGSEAADKNSAIRGTLGFTGEGQEQRRVCDLWVTYRLPQEAVT